MANLHAEKSQYPVPNAAVSKNKVAPHKAATILSIKVVTMGKSHCIDTAETSLP